MANGNSEYTDELFDNLTKARKLVEESITLLEVRSETPETKRVIEKLKETRKEILLTEVCCDCILIPDPERLVEWLKDLI